MTRHFLAICALGLAGCTQPNLAQEPELDAGTDAAEPMPEPTPAGPALVPVSTTFLNEDADAITFDAAGVPSHRHDPASSVTLGAGCPVVVKHAYLMVPGNDNPLRLRVAGTGIDPASVRAQFLRPDGMRIGAARPLQGVTANGATVFEVTALRTDEPSLGTIEGEVRVLFTARTADGLAEVTHEGCWKQTLLAPPLQLGAASIPTGVESLADNKLNALDDRPHRLGIGMINDRANGLSILSYDVTNGTAETPLLTVQLQRPSLQVARAYVRRHILQRVTRVSIPCSSSPDRCNPPAHRPPVDIRGEEGSAGGAPFAVRIRPVLVSGQLGPALACVACDRSTGAFTFKLTGTTRYRVEVVLGTFPMLKPSSAGDQFTGDIFDTTLPMADGEFAYITGTPIDDPYDGCTHFSAAGPRTCTETSRFLAYRALTRIDLSTRGALGATNLAALSPSSTVHEFGTRSRDAFTYVSVATLPPVP